MSVVVVLCCCCQNWKKHSAWTSEILSNKLRWNITEKNSSWGKRSCQRVNQAWDKPGRHGFWSQEKFPNLVLRNLKPKKYSTTLSLGRKMAGTSAATWATSASWRNWESWNFLSPTSGIACKAANKLLSKLAAHKLLMKLNTASYNKECHAVQPPIDGEGTGRRVSSQRWLQPLQQPLTPSLEQEMTAA